MLYSPLDNDYTVLRICDMQFCCLQPRKVLISKLIQILNMVKVSFRRECKCPKVIMLMKMRYYTSALNLELEF